jgi:hypothetical protein
MTDEQIQEIYALARESFFGGQKAFQLQAYPFRMTALNMAKHRNNSNFAFWKMLKEGYDHFDATHQEPKVAVCERHYVFDPAAPEDSTKPLSFNPKGACPAYQLDKTVADAVLDQRRQEQFKMAEYIASGVSTVPSREGIDGGMNPAFADKLGTQEGYDSKGRLIRVATAPGSLPRTSDKPAPAPTISVPEAAPQTESARVVMASVPMPRPAPQPKTGEAPASEHPTTITGLIGNLFGGSKAEASTVTASADREQVPVRNTSTDLAAKPKHPAVVPTTPPAPMRTASTSSAPKPRDVAPPPAPENISRPASKPPAQQTAKTEAPRAPEPEIRAAYATPPASNSGMLTGAQPVVPAGSFNSFR